MKYIRHFLGQVFASLGGLLIVGGICSPLYRDSSHLEPGQVVCMVMFGIFLVFCAVLLLKPPIVEDRPPFWFPAISGFVCSCCVLVFAVWLVIKWSTPTTVLPGWTLYVVGLCVAGSVLSAIVCVVTTTSAVLQLKRKTDERVRDPVA